MPAYRAHDLWLLPNLLSAARLPLAAAFPLVVDRPPLALCVLGLASASDVLDGWFARRLGQATPIGAVVDGIADKVFGLTVLGSLVKRGALSPFAALLLATRELGELPLAARVLVSRHARLMPEDRRANALGKMATTLELGTVVAVLLRVPHRALLLGATAALGGLAAASYWRREIRGVRGRRAVAPRRGQATRPSESRRSNPRVSVATPRAVNAATR